MAENTTLEKMVDYNRRLYALLEEARENNIALWIDIGNLEADGKLEITTCLSESLTNDPKDFIGNYMWFEPFVD